MIEEDQMDISQIYKEYYVYIYNYALKLACHPEDALDITQETFLKALEQLHTLVHSKALSQWLRTMCFHEFINKVRKDKAKYIVEIEDWNMLEQEGEGLHNIVVQPEDEVIVDEEIRDLQNGCFLAMVRKLSLNQRITFSLVDMYGLNIEHVADLLNISKGAAKGLLYRARMNIDAFFAEHCHIIDEKNPCSCQAWINFSLKRSELQKDAHRIINKLDFNEKKYTYNEEVRKKILYLYAHMPEQKPSEEWYQKVLHILDTEKI